MITIMRRSFLLDIINTFNKLHLACLKKQQNSREVIQNINILIHVATIVPGVCKNNLRLSTFKAKNWLLSKVAESS